jgi:DnaD/phage-associated family protein
MQEFNEFMTVHGVSEELMKYAVDVACGNGAPVWNYVAQVLYGWLDAGVKSVGDAKAEQERHRKKRDGPPQRRGAIDRDHNKVPLPYGGGIIV